MPAIINDHLPAFFSKKEPIAIPNLLTKNASKKNLKPLAIIQVKIKKIILK